jgi:hypothetical protein
MKTCLICTTPNEPDAASCVACGEATWAPAPAEPPTVRRPTAAPPAEDGSPKAARPTQARRGARDSA